MDELLTIEEAGKYLKLDRRSIYRYIKQGKLPAYRIAGTGQKRIRKSDLEALLVPERPIERQH